MGKAWKLETDRSKALTDRGSQASQATVFRAQRTGTRRSELRRGQRWRLHFARAAACAALRVACLAAPTARRERVGDRADRKQRKTRLGQRGASWRPKLAREGEGSTAGSWLQPQLALVLRVLRRRPRVRSLLLQLRRPLRCVYSQGADNKEGASWRWRQDCDCCTGSGFCWLETQC